MDTKKVVIVCVVIGLLALALFLGYIAFDVAFKLGMSEASISARL